MTFLEKKQREKERKAGLCLLSLFYIVQGIIKKLVAHGKVPPPTFRVGFQTSMKPICKSSNEHAYGFVPKANSISRQVDNVNNYNNIRGN